MSDLVINIRVWCWHLKVDRDLRPNVTFNRYHRGRGSRLVEVYVFPWVKP